jgi:RimJ/RimL family protein N-acetyltransferase
MPDGASPPTPPTLTGDLVELEPLGLAHAAGLLAAADSDEIFAWLRWRRPRTVADAEAWIAEALADRATGRRLPFAVKDVETGKVLGSTSCWDVDVENESLEIGSTWLARSAWRSGRNRETKLLLLTYAFETLGMERVGFQTDSENERSRSAIERLGAVHEGVHRHDRRRLDGSRRDSAWFSILRSEWPAAKARMSGAPGRGL